MKRPISRRIASLAALVVTFGLLLPTAAASAQSDPLPSWKDGKTKQSIIDFVTREGPHREPFAWG